MSLEGQRTDRKSLRTVTGRSTKWDDLAKDCVAFANGEDLRRYPRSKISEIGARYSLVENR